MKTINVFLKVFVLINFISCGEVEFSGYADLIKPEDKINVEEESQSEIVETEDSDSDDSSDSSNSDDFSNISEMKVVITCDALECEIPVTDEGNNIEEVNVIHNDGSKQSLALDSDELVVYSSEDEEIVDVEVYVDSEQKIILQSEDVNIEYEISFKELSEDKELFVQTYLSEVLEEVSLIKDIELSNKNLDAFLSEAFRIHKFNKKTYRLHYHLIEDDINSINIQGIEALSSIYKFHKINLLIFDLDFNLLSATYNLNENLSFEMPDSIKEKTKIVIVEMISNHSLDDSVQYNMNLTSDSLEFSITE